MHFAITNNNFNPAGGACCLLLGGGAKCKNKPNKANKPLLPLFRSLGGQSINQRAKHRYKANKPPKITNHYENKNQRPNMRYAVAVL